MRKTGMVLFIVMFVVFAGSVFVQDATSQEVLVSYGNLDGSPITGYVNNNLFIDVYIQTSEDAYGGDLMLCLGSDNQYIDDHLSETLGQLYYPFTEWQAALFQPPEGSPPNPAGWSSQSFIGFARTDPYYPFPVWLHLETPVKVMTFVFKVVYDDGLVGQTIECLGQGINGAYNGPSSGSDQTGFIVYDIIESYSDVVVLSNVSLDQISGIGNVTYMGEGIAVRPSLTISSTIYTSGDMFFIEITDEYDYVVYTNTIYTRPIAEGTNVIEFDTDWVITAPGTYEAYAEFTCAGDYSGDNSGYKEIIVTDFAYDDLPPSEGFDEGLLASLPEGFAIFNEDEEDPSIWAIITGDKYRSPNNSIAVLGGGLGDQWEWLVQGPIDLSDYFAPAVYFWEDERYWEDYSGEMHEFYVALDPFDIEDAKTAGAFLTHTPANHSISGFTGDSVLIELSGYGGNDKVYFAWRYVSVGDDPNARHQWFIDDIMWADMGYIPGDVNGDGLVIGGDVSYLVAYFVSGGDPPNPFWAGDTNGDCNIIGGDVSYLVNYFVGGGPAPVRGDCR